MRLMQLIGSGTRTRDLSLSAGRVEGRVENSWQECAEKRRTSYIKTAIKDRNCRFMQSKNNSEPRLAGLSTDERTVLDDLVARERLVITASDVCAIRNVSRATANQILRRLHDKGWLQRVKRGRYLMVPLGAGTSEPTVEDSWSLAMALFSPCYISGWSAAEHWDFTEQIFNSVMVVTAHPQRAGVQEIAGITFRTRTVDPKHIFGTRSIWVGSRRVEIADPHRLVIDVLDVPELGGGARHVLDVVRAYWRSEHANRDQVLRYALRLRKGVVFKRLGFTAELVGSAPNDWLEECQSHMSAGVSKFDPEGPDRGRIVTKWNLRINVPIGDDE